MRRRSETIAFRLNSEVATLVDRARDPFGISRGEWVRGLVINHLQNNPVDQVAVELIELRQSILDVQSDSRSLQDSMRRLAYVLLTQADPLTPEQAQEGVARLFRREQT